MARVARLQDTKINLRDELGKEHTFQHKPLTSASTSAKMSSKGVKKTKTTKRVLGRKTDMEKTIKAQKFAALVVLAAGCIFGITQYTNDVAVIIGGVVLVTLLVEKAK